MRALAAAAALVAAASASTPSSFDFDPSSYEIVGGPLCLDPAGLICLTGWGVSRGNVTFQAKCSPVAGSGDGQLSWCAFGINTGGNLTSWSMYPAEVFMIQVLATGQVIVEDRANIAFATPLCMSTQVSYLLASNVDANGVVTATWTRPVMLPQALNGTGYTNITNAVVPIVGAYASGEARVPAACNISALSFHDQVFNNLTINFLA
jgi:hypothetical protein